MDDLQRIRDVPVAVANLPVGHEGTFDEPNGGAMIMELRFDCRN
jgi:hypothetical protein